MRALVTGFELDQACPVNTSYEVVRRLPGHVGNLEVTADVLRCDYRRPLEPVEELIRRFRPDIFLCMGQALRREELSLERVAVNFQDDSRPASAGGGDYYGFVPHGRPVVPDGQDAYFSNLPLERMLARLQEEGYPCSISLTAGAVGCNNAMYSVLYLCRTRYPGMMGGFIHLPAHHQHPGRIKKSFSVEYLAHGIEVALEAAAE